MQKYPDEVLESASQVITEVAGVKRTVKKYLKLLLITMWEKGEEFSGKRPFGNSGWEFDLYDPLIRAGFIPGTIDTDLEIMEYDGDQAELIVISIIEYIFSR